MKAVFRKIFKSSSKDKVGGATTNNNNNNINNNNNNNNNNNINNNNSSNNTEQQQEEINVNKNVVASPARRVKCNTIAPTSGKAKLPIVPKFDTTIRAKRLMKELKDLQKQQGDLKDDRIFTADLINDNLFEWHVKLFKIDHESPLAQDMVELEVPFILLHLIFPDNFPFAPPFMRVVEPRIEKGYVMEGGAICMELLTPRGWASAYTIEAVLMQFAASLVKGQGRICRKSKINKEFNRRTAEEAFRSLVKTHDKYGWITPALQEG